MDRVGFLIEDSGERLGCLLNPETLEISRVAGLKPRRLAGGLLTGRGLKDDPLLFTGGGRTELKMNLLFDVSIAGSSIQTEDVRGLTGPLWQLAENRVDDEGLARLRLARFVWGKAWNMPGVVAAIAERFEEFTAQGVPRRSWVSLRFVRAEDPDALAPRPAAQSSGEAEPLIQELPRAENITPDRVRTHELIGGASRADEGGISGERLDAIAQKAYGNPSYWRRLAAFNGIDDPLRVVAGQVIQIPSLKQ
jgi:hypothetical protein